MTEYYDIEITPEEDFVDDHEFQDSGEKHPILPFLTPVVRKWIYGLATALAAIGVALGFVDNATVGLILNAVAAFIASPLAFANVNK